MVTRKHQYIELNDLLMWLEMQIRNCADPDDRKLLQKITRKLITFPKADVREVIHAEWKCVQTRSLLTNEPMRIHYCSHCKTVGNPNKDYCCECGAQMHTT